MSEVEERTDWQLQETATRLRLLYSECVNSNDPGSLSVLYHCALGLSLTGFDCDIDLSHSILSRLAAADFSTGDCQLALARLEAKRGRPVAARRHLNESLNKDPNNEEALEFKAEFDQQVQRDGKIFLYGIVSFAAFSFLAVSFFLKKGFGSITKAKGIGNEMGSDIKTIGASAATV